jgi:hypothetical protein
MSYCDGCGGDYGHSENCPEERRYRQESAIRDKAEGEKKTLEREWEIRAEERAKAAVAIVIAAQVEWLEAKERELLSDKRPDATARWGTYRQIASEIKRKWGSK